MFDEDGKDVGEVRALYALGESRLAEFVLIRWTKRNEDALLPADDVSTIGELGIVLAHKEAAYDRLAAFDPSANPMLNRL